MNFNWGFISGFVVGFEWQSDWIYIALGIVDFQWYTDEME